MFEAFVKEVRISAKAIFCAILIATYFKAIIIAVSNLSLSLVLLISGLFFLILFITNDL